MNYSVTVEQLEKTDPAMRYVIDIRPSDAFARGSFPGAVSVPADDPESTLAALKEIAADRSFPVFVLCHTGQRSPDVVSFLRENGYDAWDVEGGYRSFLKLQLSRIVSRPDEMRERTASIERSIIKKYRKQLWSRFTKAVRDYELIQEGDHVAVCISGGKDSMLLAKLMQEIWRHGKVRFDLTFLCMDPGYNPDNWAIIENNARILDIPLTVFHSDIFDAVAGVDRHPCYLCARMRRGYLYSRAKALGCNKIALGHHYDDVIETILMGMLYAGKVETMMPKLHSQHFEGMELIRPLYLIREADIKQWRDGNDLHFIQCACRFTENCASCGGGRTSKRDEVKALIAGLCLEEPTIAQNIFNSVTDINLYNVIGYHKGEMRYRFTDDYEMKNAPGIPEAFYRKEKN